jgi:hypothetical protein
MIATTCGGKTFKNRTVSSCVSVASEFLRSQELNRLLDFDRGFRLFFPETVGVVLVGPADEIWSNQLWDAAVGAAATFDVEIPSS